MKSKIEHLKSLNEAADTVQQTMMTMRAQSKRFSSSSSSSTNSPSELEDDQTKSSQISNMYHHAQVIKLLPSSPNSRRNSQEEQQGFILNLKLFRLLLQTLPPPHLSLNNLIRFGKFNLILVFLINYILKE